MVVFDSSIIIEALNRQKTAIKLLESYSKKGQIATTVISKYEILRGTTEKNLALVSEYLSQFIIYYFEEKAVTETVNTYKNLKANGRMINENDIIIAGIVAANDETLVTKDKDFLKLESNAITIIH